MSIDKAGTGYTLTATSGALTGATSTTFTIAGGRGAKPGIHQRADGRNCNPTPSPASRVVAVQDADGNTVTAGQGNSANISLAMTAGTGQPVRR